MLLQVRTSALSNTSGTDGNPYDMLGGKQAEAIVAELHGKYYTQTYRGKIWNASLTTASAIPLFATNATPNFFIHNPAGNMTNIVLVRINIGFHAGTGIAGAIGYAYLPNAGSGGLGTAAPYSAITAGPALRSGLVGQPYTGNVIFGSAATIGGAVPSALTVYRWSNLSQGAPITSTTSIYSMYEDFDGTVVIPPNTAFCLVGSIAIAETFMISLVAYEAPI